MEAVKLGTRNILIFVFNFKGCIIMAIKIEIITALITRYDGF